MKTIKFLSLSLFFISLYSFAFAQTKKESIKVSGNCGMCKTTIEKAAKSAGASYASWNSETKMLEVKYNSRTSNAAKIQQSIATAGYDSPGFTASQEAYDKLHGCCKYEREEATAASDCCAQKCEMKEGKCIDMEKCKTNGCKMAGEGKTMQCCSKEGEGQHGKMDCCKNGKCEKHS